eukprot:1751533-Heterocapsa_arctica.AAC.1
MPRVVMHNELPSTRTCGKEHRWQAHQEGADHSYVRQIDMHHMFDKGQQQRLQESGDLHQGQHHYSKMGGDEGERAIQELDHCTQNRRAMRIHGQCIDAGTQVPGQHGGGADVAQTGRQFYAYERND